jgi:hypothetical protein
MNRAVAHDKWRCQVWRRQGRPVPCQDGESAGGHGDAGLATRQSTDSRHSRRFPSVEPDGGRSSLTLADGGGTNGGSALPGVVRDVTPTEQNAHERTEKKQPSSRGRSTCIAFASTTPCQAGRGSRSEKRSCQMVTTAATRPACGTSAQTGQPPQSSAGERPTRPPQPRTRESPRPEQQRAYRVRDGH